MNRRFTSDFILILLDVLSVIAAFFLALWLRFDCSVDAIPEDYFYLYRLCISPVALGTILIYSGCRLYHRVWRFASFRELEFCVLAVAVCFVCHWLAVNGMRHRLPASYFIFGAAFQGIFLACTRFGYRVMRLEASIHRRRGDRDNQFNAMVIGGGIAGQMIVRELNTSLSSTSRVRCIVDDDESKWGCIIDGVRVVGGRDHILEAVQKYHIRKIFFAIPSMPPEERREILNVCKETGCQLMTLPGIYQLANEEVSVSKMREVAIEDLLGRLPIQVNNDEILENLRGKVVMVTGGGGSIGSELCRQIACHSPKQLIIFDVYENNAYDIQQELKRKHGTELNLTVLVGSVRDSRRINQVFALYKPEVVFHAAAHKHVPLMEESPCEAIKNNVLGTYKAACAAIANGTRRFVLISTDKAVNPTNIMGASKRLCEMVVQTLDKLGAEGRLDLLPELQMHLADEFGALSRNIQSPLPKGQRTEFVAVRFGNVLGSNGSVIPLFKKQIAAGGPVTVTSPDIIRYFMTIPEAVSLVLQASTYAQGGEIFVFDMGEPMKIDTLARNLIKLSGYRPDVDIKILYTGLRPGEKLFEERLMDTEGLRQTPNKLISIANPVIPESDAFIPQLFEIARSAYTNADQMKHIVSEVVPTYRYHPEKG